MKVDAAIMDANAPGEAARRLEQLGYDGGFTFEGPHDPFFPLVLASQTTERIELYTAIELFRRARFPFRVREPDWAQRTEALLERADAILHTLPT